MSFSLRAAAAQASAELRMRLRSSATFFAFLLIAAGSYLWIPKPGGHVVSISWRAGGGPVITPLFSSAYVGATMGILTSVFFLLVAFYLVTGSIRRDRETGVGAIIAATPVSNGAYLLGKLAAYSAYLAVVTGAILLVGILRFATYGVGPFDALAFFAPCALIAPPAIVFCAAMTLVFEVTPGLRGRGGLVLWFFVSMFLLTAIPMALSAGARGMGHPDHFPLFDPDGTATLETAIRQSLPTEGTVDISTGLIIFDQIPERVYWPGLAISARMVASRFVSMAWAFVPLAIALALFDRFDPARGVRRRVRAARGAAPSPADAAGETRGLKHLTPVRAEPSAFGAVLAEARLVWTSASWLRWPLLAIALLAPFVPGEGSRIAAGAFLLLLVPAISEVAAREDLAGTRGLVFAQPGVPASGSLWKLGALTLFLVVLGLPLTLRAAFGSPARGLAALGGLVFVALFAVSAGVLSGGGKLFTGTYVAILYAAVSGAPGCDFSGLLSQSPNPLITTAAYLAAGIAALAVAALVERARRV